MTAPKSLRLALALATLAGLAGLAVQTLRADAPPGQAAVDPVPCSSCDARHARLRDGVKAAPEAAPEAAP